MITQLQIYVQKPRETNPNVDLTLSGHYLHPKLTPLQRRETPERILRNLLRFKLASEAFIHDVHTIQDTGKPVVQEKLRSTRTRICKSLGS
jgi:hypothetical protein